LPNTTLLDASSARMLFVEGPEQEVHGAVAQMPEWSVSPEQRYSLPDTRIKLRGA
jgi:hypothetical protein